MPAVERRAAVFGLAHAKGLLGRLAPRRRHRIAAADVPRYLAWRNRSILPLLRLALFVGAPLYAVNYLGDISLDPESGPEVLPLRFGTAAVLAGVGLLSFYDLVKARPRATLICLGIVVSTTSTLIGMRLEGGGIFHVVATQLAVGIFAVLVAQEFALVAVVAAILFAVPNAIVAVLGPIPSSLVSADLLLISGCLGMVLLSYYLELEALSLFTATAALARQAETDPLTGLANRRTILEIAERAFAHAADEDGSLSVVMFDIDHFKQANDRQGHAAGDRVLTLVARTCARGIRGLDSLGRFGGEEFLVVLPGTAEAEAVELAERLRAAVKRARLVEQGTELGVTISLGVASRRAGDMTAAELIERADAALYAAKAAGRDRTAVDRASGACKSARRPWSASP